MINRRNLFLQAWRNAEFAVALCGGTARQHFADALKMAWQAFRAVSRRLAEIDAGNARAAAGVPSILASVRANRGIARYRQRHGYGAYDGGAWIGA